MNKIFSPCYADNHRSLASNLEFGMRISGYFKNHVRKYNKYKDLPDILLPQIKEQCVQRIRALEEVISTQKSALDDALKDVYIQLDDAKKDLELAESRIND